MGRAAGATVGSVLYLHGGGRVNEIAQQHRRPASQIAADASTVVTVPISPPWI
jgi:acetyl esterase/lipase